MVELNYKLLLAMAKGIQEEIAALGLDKPPLLYTKTPIVEQTILNHYDELITHKMVWDASRKLFADGHYARAVEAGLKALDVSVKNRVNIDRSGTNLMREAFSENKPLLSWSDRRTTSEKDEQKGYMHLYMGAFLAIRNPRAHELDLEDEPETALQLLIFVNHLMHKLDSATNQESPHAVL